MLQKLQPTLEEVQQLFEEWRRNKKRRDRIPEALWKVVVSLSGDLSVHQISKLLHLNHTAVRDRVRAHKQGDGIQRNGSAFIELGMSSLPAAGECTVEMERPNGMKMKISIKGGGGFDIVELGRAFWSNR